MSSSEQPQGPRNEDLDNGQEGHKLPPLLLVGWLIVLGWVVTYVVKNIGGSWGP